MDGQSNQGKYESAKESLASLRKSLKEEEDDLERQISDTQSRIQKIESLRDPDEKLKAILLTVMTGNVKSLRDTKIVYMHIDLLTVMLDWAMDERPTTKQTEQYVGIMKGLYSDMKNAEASIEQKFGDAKEGLEWAKKFGKHIPKTSKD